MGCFSALTRTVHFGNGGIPSGRWLRTRLTFERRANERVLHCLYVLVTFVLVDFDMYIFIWLRAWVGIISYAVVHRRYGQRIRPIPLFAFFAWTLPWVRARADAARDRASRRSFLRTGPPSICVMCKVRNRECRTFYYFSFCGTQPFGGAPFPRHPDTTVVRMNVEKHEAHLAVVFAVMADRPGQKRKSKIADDFDAILMARSGRCRCWATRTDDDVLDWACFLDFQRHGATWVHDRTCRGVGIAEGGAYRPGNGRAKRYSDRSMNEAFASKLRMAMLEQLGKI